MCTPIDIRIAPSPLRPNVQERAAIFTSLFSRDTCFSVCKSTPMLYGIDINAVRYVNGKRETPNDVVADEASVRAAFSKGCTLQVRRPPRTHGREGEALTPNCLAAARPHRWSPPRSTPRRCTSRSGSMTRRGGCARRSSANSGRWLARTRTSRRRASRASRRITTTSRFSSARQRARRSGRSSRPSTETPSRMPPRATCPRTESGNPSSRSPW